MPPLTITNRFSRRIKFFILQLADIYSKLAPTLFPLRDTTMSQIESPIESNNDIIEEQKLPTKIYSPNQVACGTLGGPVGLVYFLYANFQTLNQEEMKKKALLWGSIFIAVLVFCLPFIPEEIPSSAFTAVYIVLGKMTAENYQMKKEDIIASEDYEFHSNWRVFGLSILCLIGSIVVIFIPLFIMAMAGIIA